MAALPAGIPAIIFLFLLSITAITVSIKFSNYNKKIKGGTEEQDDEESDKNGLLWFFTKSSYKLRSIVTCTIATPFFIWGLAKTLVTSLTFDWGIVTFGLVIIASILNVYFPGEKMAILLLGCNILLVFTYAVSAVFTSRFDIPEILKLYLSIGTIYWSFMTVWNWQGYKMSSKGSTAKPKEEAYHNDRDDDVDEEEGFKDNDAVDQQEDEFKDNDVDN